MGWKINEITAPIAKARVQEALGTGGMAARAADRNAKIAERDRSAGDSSLRALHKTPAGIDGRPARPSISTDEAKLNKTERAFYQYLRAQCGDQWIGIQNITLKLAHDCRYTPDFALKHMLGFDFYEVKGFWRDDARVKIKVAARMFRWANFVAVQRIKGEWKFEEIKP